MLRIVVSFMLKIKTKLRNISQNLEHNILNSTPILAVKLYSDAVSVMRLKSDISNNGLWELDRIETWSLKEHIGENPFPEHYDYVVSQIKQVCLAAKVKKVDTSIAIPASDFETQILTLPSINEKEFNKEVILEDFWTEHLPHLTYPSDYIIRYQFLYVDSQMDESHILCSWIKKEKVNYYIDALLEADLLPVYIENELFSLVNAVYESLDLVKREQPILILNLSFENHYIVSLLGKRICIQNISISEFDEPLLNVLEKVNDLSGSFWDEVSLRISGQIQQKINFFQEEYNFPENPILYIVSDYKSGQKVYDLLSQHLNCDMVMWSIPSGVSSSPDYARYVDYFENVSIFASVFGMCLQKIGVSNKEKFLPYLHRFNFLPHAEGLIKNRCWQKVQSKIKHVGIIGVVVSLLIIGVLDGVGWIKSYYTVKPYEGLYSQSQKVSKKRKEIENDGIKLQKIQRKTNELYKSRTYIRFFQKLAKNVPLKAELQSVSINKKSEIIMTGVAYNQEVIAQFSHNLSQQGLISEPSIEQVKKGKYFYFKMISRLMKSG